ncbi:antitermination protein Q [Pseudomonas azerbaijanorientalis]|nr:antitermination protein Q [Pseudomonas azerbaijanorientalis]
MMVRKPALHPLGDTEYLLEQWGWWRMDGRGVPSYASPMLALMRDAMPSPAKSYCITDELACVVDAALARLCKRDQQMGDVVWLYFGAKWPAIRVGRFHQVSEGKARELMKAGVAWIDCVLESIKDGAGQDVRKNIDIPLIGLVEITADRCNDLSIQLHTN